MYCHSHLAGQNKHKQKLSLYEIPDPDWGIRSEKILHMKISWLKLLVDKNVYQKNVEETNLNYGIEVLCQNILRPLRGIPYKVGFKIIYPSKKKTCLGYVEVSTIVSLL